MIGKIIAVARTREEAIDTMHRALSEYVIEGVKTTIPFHLQLMKDERFRSGDFNTKFLEGFKMIDKVSHHCCRYLSRLSLSSELSKHSPSTYFPENSREFSDHSFYQRIRAGCAAGEQNFQRLLSGNQSVGNISSFV